MYTRGEEPKPKEPFFPLLLRREFIAKVKTLSDAEYRIWELVAFGLRAREIAQIRVTSIATVNSQIAAVYRKLEFRHASEATVTYWVYRYQINNF